MQPVADEFLNLLAKSRLLSQPQIDSVVQNCGIDEEATAAEVAAAFVEQQLLTQFQAERLLEGRSRGFLIGGYKLLEILGTGGMGWLYLAEDVRTGDKVALKVLSDRHRDDAGMLARLKLEAAVQLDHPNIVKTYKFDLAEGAFDVYYVIMELVEGINLLELISRQGRIPWRQACDFFRQAAAGLHHAHEAGLVHRDIKPENFLIQGDGTVKLLDFGLSLLEHAEEDEFSLAMIFGHDCLGSADYMPPEQWVDSGAVDARADIYSLGCTMYVSLTRCCPFPGKTNREKMEAHRTKKPRPVRGFAPDVPEKVEAVIAKMMAKDPAERFQTAQDVVQALEPFAGREPVSFDFQALLEARAAEAEQRIASMKRQHRKTVDLSNAEASGREATKTPPDDAATIDTSLQQDTEPMRTAAPAVRMVDPFDTLSEGALRGTASGQPAAAAPTTAAPHAWLVPLDGGQPIPLAKSRVVIGRSADCDVRIDSGPVSGQHCELRFEGSWWRIIDLNSKNGVQVNGIPVSAQLLCAGDRLTIAGERHFRIDETPNPSRRRFGLRRLSLWIALAAALALTAVASWWLSG